MMSMRDLPRGMCIRAHRRRFGACLLDIVVLDVCWDRDELLLLLLREKFVRAELERDVDEGVCAWLEVAVDEEIGD